MKTKVGICCAVEPSKGYGNFRRSLLLAKYLKKKKINIIFIIKNNSIVKHELLKEKIHYVLIPETFSMSKTKLFLINTFLQKHLDAIIIDMREHGQEISKTFFQQNIKSILLDDAWCKKAYSEIIFNPTMIKKYHSYEKINKKSKLFLGTEYFITDPYFMKNKKKPSSIIDKKKYDIVISMGGSDPTNLSNSILKELLKIPNIQISLIIGPFFKNKEKLMNMNMKNKKIRFIESPKSIWKIFQKSDLVICNAGSALFELATQQIPTLCFVAVSHQLPYARFFSKRGFSINMNSWKKSKSKKLPKLIFQLLNNKNERKKISQIGNKIVDGKGTDRVGKIIINELKVKKSLQVLVYQH